MFHVPVVRKPTCGWVKSWVEQNSTFKFETSYGTGFTKINTWPSENFSDLYDCENQSKEYILVKKDRKEGTWIRLAAGFETPEDVIISQLNQLLSCLPPSDGSLMTPPSSSDFQYK